MNGDSLHPFDRVIDALRERGSRLRVRSADQVQATCPAHADSKASLSIGRRDDRVLLHCHAKCPRSKVLAALGLRAPDLFMDAGIRRGRPTIVARYEYRDRNGVVVARKVRNDRKHFYWQRPDASARGGWCAGLGGLQVPALYGMPTLLGASLVFVVEGEKAVDRLRALEVAATCGHAGAGSWRATSELLDLVAPGAIVVMLPDNDTPGERHALHVAAELFAAGMDKSIVVKVVALAGVAPGGDVFDWLEAGHTDRELLDLVSSRPAWSPSAAEEDRRQRRRDQTRDRMRSLRAARRAAISSQPIHDADGAAFAAVMAFLGREASWLRRMRTELLAEGHPDRAVRRALERGIRDGVIQVSEDDGTREATRGRKKLYRLSSVTPSVPLQTLADIRGVTPSDPLDATKWGSGTERPTCVDEIRSDKPGGAASVTLCAVTQGERASSTLQKDGDLLRHKSVTPGAPLGNMVEPSDERAADDGLRPERRRDVESGHCRGCAVPGEANWCRLCRWSPTYWKRDVAAPGRPTAATCATEPCSEVERCAFAAGCVQQRFSIPGELREDAHG
jgi:hypothetical protein